jgi:hypothetical protein
MKTKRYNGEESSYTGDDPIVKYRMGMIDDKGNDITKKSEPEYKDESMGEFTTTADLNAPKAVEKTVVKTKVAPVKSKEFKPLTNKDEEGNKLPTDVKKPFIAIPKNAAGMQQFRSDAESPIGRLFKSITGSKSQRTTAAEKGMKKGGSVSSASKRADGCATKGKTRGKIC